VAGLLGKSSSLEVKHVKHVGQKRLIKYRRRVKREREITLARAEGTHP